MAEHRLAPAATGEPNHPALEQALTAGRFVEGTASSAEVHSAYDDPTGRHPAMTAVQLAMQRS